METVQKVEEIQIMDWSGAGKGRGKFLNLRVSESMRSIDFGNVGLNIEEVLVLSR